MPRPSPITDAQKPEILRLYAEGMSRNALAERFGASRGFMGYFLKDSGARIRSSPEVCTVQLPDGVNAFVDAPNRPEAAYWTGFLMADGCISQRKAKGRALGVICQLQARDTGHLDKLASFVGLGSVRPITITRFMRPTLHHARWCVYQQALAETLISYGVAQRKSKTATVCHSLAMNAHFWRGVVDGDGSLRLHRRGNHQAAILHLCGSQFLMQQYAEFVRFHSTAAATVYDSKGVWNVQISATSAVRLIRLMYGVGGVSLDRKQAIADRIMSMTWKATGHRR